VEFLDELPFLLEQILNGLLFGVCYLLIALGLSLIFSLGGVVNLAHGAFYALGAYFTVEISKLLGFPGAFVFAPVVVALIGVAIERLFLRRFYDQAPVLSLLFTFGLAMIAEQGLRIVWGASPLNYAIPEFLKGQVIVGDFIYSRYRLSLIVVAVVAVGATWYLLNRTSFGKIVKAGVAEPDMVRVLGISLAPILTATAALGIGLAGLAGVIVAPIFTIHPAMGSEIITAAFVVVVVGGLGSFWGCVLAAFLIGVVRGITFYFWPAASEASMYALMLLVLLLRPRGLMGERMKRLES
jgi:branched-chain amino acid transport system permease protein